MDKLKQLKPFIYISFGIIFFTIINNVGAISEFLGKIFNLVAIFVYGIFISAFLNPVLEYFEKHSKLKRIQSILIIYFTVVTIVSLLLFLGVPSFIKTKANGKMGFGLSWQSEAISGAKEAAEKVARYNYLSAYMNDRIANNEKFKNYYQGLIRNNTYAKAMDAALEHNDKKAFLDNDLAQLYSDFTMFDSAGRLDDLRAMAKAAIPTSDADVQDLIDNTSTKDLKGEEKEKAEKEKENLKQATTKKEQITQQIQELLNERE